jgi:hypothetical protein
LDSAINLDGLVFIDVSCVGVGCIIVENEGLLVRFVNAVLQKFRQLIEIFLGNQNRVVFFAIEDKIYRIAAGKRNAGNDKHNRRDENNEPEPG